MGRMPILAMLQYKVDYIRVTHPSAGRHQHRSVMLPLDLHKSDTYFTNVPSCKRLSDFKNTTLFICIPIGIPASLQLCKVKFFMLYFLAGLTLAQANNHPIALPSTSASLTTGAPIPIDNDHSPMQPLKAAENTFYITHIVLHHAKFLTKKAKKQLLSPYLNQHLGLEKINSLVESIKAYYIKKGYPTTQVQLVVGQNLKAGQLELMVHLGFIEAIILNGHHARDQLKIMTAFPWHQGKPLYLPYLEQGIDQMNAVTSSQATLKILPGLQQGGSFIQVDQTIHHPIRFDIGGDNLGEKGTGQWRWKYNLALDNIISINDSFLVHFPLGYFIFSTTHNIRSSLTPIQATNYDGRYHCKSHSHQYDVKFNMYKRRAFKGDFLVNFTHTTTENYLQDVLIQSQSGTQSQYKIGMEHSGLLWKGAYSLGIDFTQDLTGLLTKDHPTTKAPTIPQETFQKLHIHCTWTRPLSVFNQLLNYQLSCTGQYSKHELPSTHQLNITGFEAVQGISQSYTGNTGICCNHELSLHHILPSVSWLCPLQFFNQLHIGYLPQATNADPNKPIGKLPLTLMSYAMGFRYHHEWMHFDLTYAQPIYSPKHITLPTKEYKLYISYALKLNNLFKL
eukprot:gene1030-1305_t